ncbi:MAG: hypothetical protein K2Q97_20230 [Burkholderiaceae bacterium]|nr:hypothetical protein [Burkholderiaceae bacterium]
MSTGIKPEWDMPPDGDFARYVDQLTAPPPAAAVAQARPVPAGATESASSPPPSPSIRRPVLANPQSPSLPPDLQRVLPTLGAGLRLMRYVLLALSVAHIASLLVWGWGSWVGLLMMASLWWGLGRFGAVVAQVLNRPGADTQAIQDRLRQARLQRIPTKKKP